jgi:Zn-dependent peptidase ImmA (M78 family)
VTEWVTITVPEFKAVTVYDISQTDGEPLHKLDLLKGNVDNYEELFSALEKTSPASVKFVDNVIGGNGYFNHDKKQIIINGGMSEQQNLKTLIHEIAHARLHDKDAKASHEQGSPSK